MLQRLGVPQPHDHDVLFYDHDGDVVSAVVDHAEAAVASGEHVVLVVTLAHWDAIHAGLGVRGLDPDALRAGGQLVVLDAADTLSRFMVNDLPHPGLFKATLGTVLEAARAGTHRVRVFGEMVTLLWDAGNVGGAIDLEALWNVLAQIHDFTLLCAYPSGHLDSARLAEVSQVCKLHSHVLPPSSYGSGRTRCLITQPAANSAVFVGLAEAIPAARRFVARVLTQWGEDDLQSDAALVTSELATNSVVHAGSPFRAQVDHTGEVIRITIEDTGAGRAEGRTATQQEVDGRGVQIIDALAQSWGSDLRLGGKTVWAEFPASTPRPLPR